MEILIISAIIIFTLVVVAFAFGPKVLEWFFDTLDEWVDIIDSAKDEKR